MAVDPDDRVSTDCEHRQHGTRPVDAEARDPSDPSSVDIEQIRRVGGYEQLQASHPGEWNAIERPGAGAGGGDFR